VKLFQIEEPDGSPSDPHAPGAAIGIDASGINGEVAFAVGGNAVALADRDGFDVELLAPPLDAAVPAWQAFFEGARLRAERALGRPVTHAVLVAATAPHRETLSSAAEAAGLVLLEIMSRNAIGAGQPAACSAAILAEDLAPRPESR
jgi:hypothetical protein